MPFAGQAAGSGANRRSFWYRMKNDYKTSRHLVLDRLAAKKKLRLLTSTDLYLKNSLEGYRVSNFKLFTLNLQNPLVWLSTGVLFLFCHSATDSPLTFGLLFASLGLLLNYHLECVESFGRVSKNADYLATNETSRNKLLVAYLGLSPRTNYQDSFVWINRIFDFFWPFLSHLIHFELNQFFREQIESGSLANSLDSSKRLFYAFLRQLDTQVLVVERFQLGQQPPRIKNIDVQERHELGALNVEKRNKRAVAEKTIETGLKIAVKKIAKLPADTKANQPGVHYSKDLVKIRKKNGGKREKSLVFDLEFDYNGDMNLSVIYRYLCCCSSRMGLQDVFLNIKLRLVVGPIREELPFVEQISLTLLELPKFGYKGIAMVELAELKIVRGVLNRLTRENLLYPKCLTLSFGEFLQRLASDPGKMAKFEEALKRKKDEQSASKTAVAHKEVSMSARLMARALLCSCMFTNIILRGCQRKRRPSGGSTSGEPPPSGSLGPPVSR